MKMTLQLTAAERSKHIEDMHKIGWVVHESKSVLHLGKHKAMPDRVVTFIRKRESE